jgi:hypothetical protein
MAEMGSENQNGADLMTNYGRKVEKVDQIWCPFVEMRKRKPYLVG